MITATPKEKAEELINIFGKELAIKCVDEIIHFGSLVGIREPMMYWNIVKSDIKKTQDDKTRVDNTI